jgi:DNA polymerase-3 subunit beta
VKFTANASNLALALSHVMRSINMRLSLVGGRGVLMEAEGSHVVLTGTDLDTVTRIRVAAKVEQPGRLLLGADRLTTAFLRPSASDAVFQVSGGMVRLAIGRSKFNLNQMNADDFPGMNLLADDPVFLLPGAQLHHAADQVAFAAAKPEDNKPTQVGTAFRFMHKHVQVVAGTGVFAIAELQLPYTGDVRPEPGEEIVLLPSSLERMQKLFDEGDTVRVSHSGGWAAFFVDGREFHTKTQAEDFPGAQIDRILENAHANLCSWLECDRAVLLDGVRRMDVVASRDPNHPLRLHAHDSRLDLYSATDEGDSSEEVDVDRDGPEFIGAVNASHLATLLGKIPGDRVRIDFPETPVQAIVLRPAATPEGTPPYTLLQSPIHPGAPFAAATMAGPRSGT